MSNITHKGYMILDTEAVADALYITHKIQPRSITWVSSAAQAGDECILKDSDGVVRFHAVASGANFMYPAFPQHSWEGLEVDTLDSGVVYIEF